MRHGCRRLIALAIVLVAPAPRVAGAAEDEPREGAITIFASPAILPVGTRCRIELKPEENDRETVETVFEGTIAQTSEEAIRLKVASERRSVARKSPAANLPLLNRLTRNVGVGVPRPGEERIVSISVAEIRAVHCLGVAGE